MKFLTKYGARAAAVLASLLVAPAFAHITLQTQQAPVGSYYKAVFRVPHGCAGSPTTSIKVRIPEGVIDVKPQPKPGWTLQIIKGKYAHPYNHHGAEATSGVQEVIWTGKLPDEYYDEFVLMSFLTPTLKAGDTLYFPVVQNCEKGVNRWIDTSGSGSEPAPHLKLLPKP